MNYDAVLFDFDGTLATTAQDVWDSVVFAATRVGAALPEEVRADTANLALSQQELFSMLAPAVSPDLLDVFRTELTEHYRAQSTHPHTGFYPGAEELLAALRAANIPAHVATAKEADALQRLLSLKGWRHWFGRCLSPDSFAGERRTKAELIAELLKGMPKGSRTIYVGDSASDVAAAHANGIPCIAATYGDGNTEALLAENPEYVVHSANEILPLLESGGQH